MRERPFYLAGKPSRSDSPLDVVNPYDRLNSWTAWLASPARFDGAADATVAAAGRMRELAAYERATNRQLS